jgi:ribosomal protein S18 acetylase RimI-like enzyme
MENINIREANLPDDFQDVLNLWQTAGPGIHLGKSDSYPEIMKKIQRDPDLFIIAETEREIIGAVLGGFDGRRGIVYHLAIMKAYRKHGIGSKLMAELESRFQLKGCIRSYLLVTPDNQEAIHFYQAHGWEKMDLLVLGKDLA